MNATALKDRQVAQLPQRGDDEKTEVCMVCRGEGRVPYVAVDRFTGTNKLTTATCCRCLGAGRIQSH